MNKLFIGLLGAMLATVPAFGASNVVARTAPAASGVPDPNDPVEKEFQKLMADDDAAQAEVDQWIRDNNEFAAKGAGMPAAQMRRRIQDRFEPVRKAYEDFLQRHPNHARARLAYAGFLGDIKDEDSAHEQLEKALAVDTNNPAIYNNLANIEGHTGSVKKAFEYYAKAIELNPLEPVYYHNLGTTVFLFRTDAKEYYGINEDQVFAKALQLYSNAMRLDPENFPLASDVAQSYYVIKPMRTDEALHSWTNALHIAHDEIEREGVYIHFARIKFMAGRFAEARTHLNAITNEMYLELKGRILRNIEQKEHPTNGAPATIEAPPDKGSVPATNAAPEIKSEIRNPKSDTNSEFSNARNERTNAALNLRHAAPGTQSEIRAATTNGHERAQRTQKTGLFPSLCVLCGLSWRS